MPVAARFLILGFVERGAGGGPVVMWFGGPIVHAGGMLVIGVMVDMATMDGTAAINDGGGMVLVAGIGGIIVIPVTSSVVGRGWSVEGRMMVGPTG